MTHRSRFVLALLLTSFAPGLASAEGVLGYYRYPALTGDTVVFAAEGDLWVVGVGGGLARRLTTHPGEETHPTVSPDGSTVAFTAEYEGAQEVYSMPITGGLPSRLTWEPDASLATTWTPDGKVVYTTRHYSTLPNSQLVVIDPTSGSYERLPLAEASEGSYNDVGDALFFTRPAFHNNVTKRYRGGTARRIWVFREGADEAERLSDDYAGENHTPMWWDSRLYFITDRDGTMNIWSMDEAGADLAQHTHHSGWDVRDAALDGGRIVYQVGADLWLFDVATGDTQLISITLASDVDQWRDKWVKEPMEYLTSVRLHPKGESVVLTARGRVFVAPVESGRLRRVSHREGVRYRNAVFMPDGDNLLALSDESGELEFVALPADGAGDSHSITADGTILRFEGSPSPNGKWIAYTDQNRDLWLLELATQQQKVVSTNREGSSDIAWSPDSRWLAFVQSAVNSFNQVLIYKLADASLTELTSDRINSWSPAWDPNGDWLYFLSDRDLRSLVGSPWGTRQPEPYFDKPDKIFQVALRKGLRSPFKPLDELYQPGEEDEEEGTSEAHHDNESKKRNSGRNEIEPLPPIAPIEIDLAGIAGRVYEVPVPAGNFFGLEVGKTTLFWLATDSGPDAKTHLMALPIKNKGDAPERLVEDTSSYELSLDGKKILARHEDQIYVFDAGAEAPSDLAKTKVPLDGWTFSIDVREDWRQIFIDAWRLERDYFYDPGMHGLDWEAVRDKYLTLVDRVTTRAELSELIGRVVGELSALHTSVRGGDHREGPDEVTVASLGARLARDQAAGGYRVEYIYRSDPDYPSERSPLSDPELGIEPGDVIVAINGADTLSVPHIGRLLSNQQGRQVRLRIAGSAGDSSDSSQSGDAGDSGRDVIVVPTDNERRLRYADWQYTRRLEVEERGAGKIGYVHLQAMGSRNLTEWYRQFYPVFNRQGLILDMRHNRGGNIDSILLEKLLRRAWFYWQGRVEEPSWNMQYAFRGHMVVLCDAQTASDGEAFTEGFRRLGLGKVIGTRTWGGEIWLSSSNRLSDRGIARAPMWGVYDEEGNWLIEQHGVVPDIEVDNLPHATFEGHDLQLETAIDYLLAEIERDPRGVPKAPPYPNLSFDYAPESDQGP